MASARAQKSSPLAPRQPLAGLLPLPLDPQVKLALSDILIALDADDRVTCYWDIAQHLHDLFEQPPMHSALKRPWGEARKLVRKLYDLSPQLPRWAGKHNQPLWGEYEEYPVLGCLLFTPDPKHAEKIQVFKLMVLTAAMLTRQGGTIDRGVLVAGADEVRRASPAASDRATAIRQLSAPDLRITPLLALLASIQQYLPTTSEGSQARRCLNAIQKLGLAVLSARLPRRSPLGQKVEAEELANVEGGVFAGLEPTFAEDEDEDGSGDVEPRTVFEEQPVEPGGELSNRGFNGAAQTSRYWLVRAQSGGLWDRGRINPIEMPKLRNYLAGLAKRAKAGLVTPAVALLTALVAATGVDVKAILAFELGPDGDVTWTGQYRRRLPPPEGAFVPKDPVKAYFASGHVFEIMFELPRVCGDLLKLVRPSSQPTSIALGSLIGLSDEGSPSLPQAIGKELHNQISPRLTYRHLRTALRHEVYVKTQDPLMAYLVAGQSHQTPPVRLYYTALSIDSVLAIQRAAIEGLFGKAQ